MAATKKPKLNRKLAVAIAKDVLKRLRWTTPRNGTYIDIGPSFDVDTNADVDAKSVITQIQKDCHVCALGACMLSYVAIEDEFTVGELESMAPEKMRAEMSEAFDLETLLDIERAFEGWDGVYSFTEKYPDDPKKRLRAIMQNVIKNNGEFVLPKEDREAKAAEGW